MEWDTTLRPLLSPLGLELYDVEFSGGTLNVVVNRPGGVDLEALTKANRTISEWLDANDPIAGRFTLDVSSPGLERRLRTPAHFTSAIGELVTLRELRKGEATRRLEGTLTAVDTSTLTMDDNELGAVTVAFDAIERARTVFAWGATKPASSKGTKASSTSKKG
ncbi:MAG TPA: ribosome maturation factor RimP [Acidimicrobiales bacterium]|jgi:ribosome maturation factor RimP|nr:ribosome maturation factor RimP [Acidimicrobiales bacterium]